MKRWKFTLALFLFFVGVLSGVRHLDSESTLYEQCVNNVLGQAVSSNLYPQHRDMILAKVQTPGSHFTFRGQTCPRLLKRHNEIIEAHLLGRAGDLPKNAPAFGTLPQT